jgi:chromosome partitioning protein
LTHYVENRRAWGERIARELDGPQHLCLDAAAGGDTETCAALVDAVDALAQDHSFIVIDTPGHDGSLSRLAHSMADTLITPLNDSFVDFDVLGTVDPETFAVSDISHYAKMVQEVRRQRVQHDGGSIDWVVMRNRLSMLGTRNKRLVGVALQELSRRLEFRTIEGFAERMIFREFYPRGLTALDDFDEVTLGTRPTMSHATARQEVANLLNSINLGSLIAAVETPPPGEAIAESDRHAA